MTATQRRMLTLVAAGGCLAVAHWLDPWAYQHLAWPAAGDRDWGRLLRILGFIPTWAAVAGLLWAESRSGKPNATASTNPATGPTHFTHRNSCGFHSLTDAIVAPTSNA